MPSQTYLHKRDGVSLIRMPRVSGGQAYATYIHQLAFFGDDDALGITWDGDPATGQGGRNLWLSTESWPAASRPALLQIPIEGCNGTGLSPTRVIQCSTLSQGMSIKDIAWHGSGFFAIIGNTGGALWLVSIGVDGKNLVQLNTSLPLSPRAICFDGKIIYLTAQYGGIIDVLLLFDTTGTQINAYLVASPTGPGNQPLGVAWNGCHLAFKSVRTPIDFFLADVASMPKYRSVQPVLVESTATPSPTIDYEQSPVAWDGAFYWSLSSEDQFGGG